MLLSKKIRQLEMKTRRQARVRLDKAAKINNLIQCLSKFKSTMEYKNVDFTVDKVKMYESVRVALAGIYHDNP